MTDRKETQGELLIAALAPSLGQTLAPYAIALSHMAAIVVGLFVAANTDGTVSAVELQTIIIGAIGTVGVYLLPLLPNSPVTNILKTAVASAAAVVAGVFTAIAGGTPSDWLTFAALVIGAVLTGIVDNAPQIGKQVNGALNLTKEVGGQVADALATIEVNPSKYQGRPGVEGIDPRSF
jgi:hypothetical protein